MNKFIWLLVSCIVLFSFSVQANFFCDAFSLFCGEDVSSVSDLKSFDIISKKGFINRVFDDDFIISSSKVFYDEGDCGLYTCDVFVTIENKGLFTRQFDISLLGVDYYSFYKLERVDYDSYESELKCRVVLEFNGSNEYCEWVVKPGVKYVDGWVEKDNPSNLPIGGGKVGLYKFVIPKRFGTFTKFDVSISYGLWSELVLDPFVNTTRYLEDYNTTDSTYWVTSTAGVNTGASRLELNTSSGGNSLDYVCTETDTSGAPIYGVNYRGAYFPLSTAAPISDINVSLKKAGNPEGAVNLIVQQADGSNHPTGTILANVSVPAASVGTSYANITFSVNTQSLSADDYTFFMYCDECTNGNNYFHERDESPSGCGDSGILESGDSGSSWSTPAKNVVFEVYTADSVYNTSLNYWESVEVVPNVTGKTFKQLSFSINASDASNFSFGFTCDNSSWSTISPDTLTNCSSAGSVFRFNVSIDGGNATDTPWLGNVTWDFDYSSLTVTNGAPSDSLITSNSSLLFNCTGRSDFGMVNLSLIRDGVYETTVSGAGALLNITTVISSGSEGSHLWSCEGNDAIGDSSIATNFSYVVDTTPPVVNESNISDIASDSLPIFQSWFYNVSDDNLDSCYFATSDNSSNTTIFCNIPTNVSWLVGGDKNLTYCANDSAGNFACNVSSISVLAVTTNYNVSSDPVLEGENNTLVLEVNASGVSNFNVSAMLWWNNSYRTVTYVNSSESFVFSSSFITPFVGSDGGNLINYSWLYNVSDYGFNGMISDNQSVNKINIFSCDATINATQAFAYNFTLKQETDDAILNGTIDANFALWVDDPVSNVSITFNDEINVTSLLLCISPVNGTLFVDSQINYFASSYDPRDYFLINASASNDTQNVSLYLLPISLADPITFNVVDRQLNGIESVYIYVERYDVGTDSFKLVAMGRTDNDGKDIIYLRQNDVWYLVKLSRDGSIVYIDPTSRKITDDEITFKLDSTSLGENLQTLGETTFLLYNTSSSVILTYNNPSGVSTTNCLNVIQRNTTSDITLGYECLTSASGTISIPVDATLGTIIATYSSSINPTENLAVLIIDQVNSVVDIGLTGLFASFIIILVLALVGAVIGKVSTTIVFTIIGGLFCIWMGFLSIGYAAIVAFIVGTGGVLILLSKN